MTTEQQKTEIIEQLKQGEVVVEFKKLNGDYRKMHCTLQEGVVPTANKADPLNINELLLLKILLPVNIE